MNDAGDADDGADAPRPRRDIPLLPRPPADDGLGTPPPFGNMDPALLICDTPEVLGTLPPARGSGDEGTVPELAGDAVPVGVDPAFDP